jgi:hypothetical protein
MKPVSVVVVLVVLLSTYSCQKEQPVPAAPESSKFLPMSIGSYWVYETYVVDSLGNESLLPYHDSLIVTKDSIVNGIKYKVVEGTQFFSSGWKILALWQDSAKSLVNVNGTVLFAENRINDTINSMVACVSPPDTLFTLFTIMENPSYTVQVPAGLFQVLNAKQMIKTFDMHGSSGSQNNPKTMVNNQYYAPNVGLISDCWAFASQYYELGKYHKRVLLRYHIAQ